MNMDILEWTGYIASGIIALSMTMNSIVKFRWINLAGAATFAVYGFLIDAYPVILLNGFIVIVDAYYLVKIYTRSLVFDTLDMKGDNNYLMKFLEFHNSDIQKYFPDFFNESRSDSVCFIILRNMAVAGLFIAHKENKTELRVKLDYAVPEYRDYRNGRFVLNHLRESFKKDGFRKVLAGSRTPDHNRYLKKLGFNETGSGEFEILL